jgi:hypothetical protein
MDLPADERNVTAVMLHAGAGPQIAESSSLPAATAIKHAERVGLSHGPVFSESREGRRPLPEIQR